MANFGKLTTVVELTDIEEDTGDVYFSNAEGSIVVGVSSDTWDKMDKINMLTLEIRRGYDVKGEAD